MNTYWIIISVIIQVFLTAIIAILGFLIKTTIFNAMDEMKASIQNLEKEIKDSAEKNTRSHENIWIEHHRLERDFVELKAQCTQHRIENHKE